MTATRVPPGDAQVVQVIRPAGDLDASSAGLLHDLLSALAARPGRRHLVIDLGQITFLDAAGLGALIRGRNHARDTGGGFALACTDGTALRLLRLTGLIAVLGVCDSVDQARLKALGRPAAAPPQPAP